ncbi:hypothetical protein DY000_02036089 [Brassica cretica]|uniref:AAA-type ATPase N-terminal domain-containing protein n=1 Tax=Brassica cretica TaxID=69181 RepID=A0ABQ7DRK3_BRACR|nr:hypothetical protein DY000_02036089 [Brassica cretica]
MKVYSYLNSLSSIEEFTEKKSNEIILHLDRNQIVGDEFLGARVCWYNKDGTRSFVLKMRKADKRRILQHIHRVTDELEQRNTELKLFMNVNDDMKRKKNVRWRSIPFNYPCTFDNIAMETDLKNKTRRKSVIVIEDLDRFISSKPTALLRRERAQAVPTGGRDVPERRVSESRRDRRADDREPKFAYSRVEACHQCYAD